MRIIGLAICWLVLFASCVLFIGCAFLLVTFQPQRGAAGLVNGIIVYLWFGMAIAAAVGIVSAVCIRSPKVIPSEETASEETTRQKMFDQALELDQRGDWSEAIALYERLAEEGQDRHDAEYARNCAQQIREKMKMANDAKTVGF